MNDNLTTRLARLGAEVRLRQITAEMDLLHRAFPEIEQARKHAQQVQQAAHARAAKRRKHAA